MAALNQMTVFNINSCNYIKCINTFLDVDFIVCRTRGFCSNECEEEHNKGGRMIEEFNYESMDNANFIKRLKPALKAGWLSIRLSDKKIIMGGVERFETKWHHTKLAQHKDCIMGHKILFDLFNAKATKCMNCYKVVVRPNTVKELIQLMKLQESMGYPSKCGTEGRSFVPALYGGYFYADSLEEGRERYREVRDAVSFNISKDITVILKRGCTEYERKWGRSDEWEQTEKDLFWEQLCYENIIFESSPYQSGLVKISTVQDWLEFAWEHGDMTCMEFNNGEPYWPPVITYHEDI